MEEGPGPLLGQRIRRRALVRIWDARRQKKSDKKKRTKDSREGEGGEKGGNKLVPFATSRKTNRSNPNGGVSFTSARGCSSRTTPARDDRERERERERERRKEGTKRTHAEGQDDIVRRLLPTNHQRY